MLTLQRRRGEMYSGRGGLKLDIQVLSAPNQLPLYPLHFRKMIRLFSSEALLLVKALPTSEKTKFVWAVEWNNSYDTPHKLSSLEVCICL